MDDVARHGDVDITHGVVPVQGESSVKGTGPILGDFVVGIERINKVVRIFFGKMFDTKSSTYEVNVVGLVVWRQRPGVDVAGLHMCGEGY